MMGAAETVNWNKKDEILGQRKEWEKMFFWKKKKVGLCLFAATIILAATACGRKAEPSGSETADNEIISRQASVGEAGTNEAVPTKEASEPEPEETAIAAGTFGFSVSDSENEPSWAKAVELEAEFLAGLNLDGVGDSDDEAYVSVFHFGDRFPDKITVLRIHLGTGETMAKIFPVYGFLSLKTGKLFSENRDAIVLEIMDATSTYGAATIFVVRVDAADSAPYFVPYSTSTVVLDTTDDLIPWVISGSEIADREGVGLQQLVIYSLDAEYPKAKPMIKNLTYWNKETMEWEWMVE